MIFQIKVNFSMMIRTKKLYLIVLKIKHNIINSKYGEDIDIEEMINYIKSAAFISNIKINQDLRSSIQKLEK